MSLVSKDHTYTEVAFDKPWWKIDSRLGFDPPEDAEGLKREKEWQKQFAGRQQQLRAEWTEVEKEVSSVSPTVKEKEEKEKEDKKKRLGNMLSSAMKTNVKKLVRHGIPSELRGSIWFSKSGASKKKIDNPDIYSAYIIKIDPDAPVMEEIQMDIARTFSMHLMFANQLTKRMMLRILAAFTIRNPTYGYCQNMTFIVGMILFFLPEEDAFWLFVTIMEDILPVDFCSPTLIGLRVDQKVLEILVKERLPKLHAHFTKYHIDISCFTTGWLLRLFVNVFPVETTLRIWDCFLFEGSKVLFRVALAFLKLHDEQLKQCTDSGEVMLFLSTECKLEYDADRLIKACASFWALRRRQINDLRTKFIIEEHGSQSLTSSVDDIALDSSDEDSKPEEKSNDESLSKSPSLANDGNSKSEEPVPAPAAESGTSNPENDPDYIDLR